MIPTFTLSGLGASYVPAKHDESRVSNAAKRRLRKSKTKKSTYLDQQQDRCLSSKEGSHPVASDLDLDVEEGGSRPGIREPSRVERTRLEEVWEREVEILWRVMDRGRESRGRDHLSRRVSRESRRRSRWRVEVWLDGDERGSLLGLGVTKREERWRGQLEPVLSRSRFFGSFFSRDRRTMHSRLGWMKGLLSEELWTKRTIDSQKIPPRESVARRVVVSSNRSEIDRISDSSMMP